MSRCSLAAVAALFFCSVAAQGQYPGLVKKPDSAAPVLRSVAVLEWTGQPGKPSASRLVPVSVYDGEQLNDGTIYLNRPEPLAIAGGTEYELQQDGKPTGLFDVFGSAKVHESWIGVGAWKPLTKAEAAQAAGAFNTSSLLHGVDAPEDDKPVLHRKHPKGTDTDDAKPSASSQDAGTSSTANTEATDPDRPTIRRRHSVAPEGEIETSTAAPDPDRPRLKHGKPDDLVNTETPQLTGLPPTMQQAVAVSDAGNRAEHPWKYTWANPEDESKMKTALEAIARTALGLDMPPAQAHSSAAHKTPVRRKNSMLPSAPPVTLADENFRVFELAYGATATLVLTASTPLPESTPNPSQSTEPDRPAIHRGKPTIAPTAQTAPAHAVKPVPQKYVTLIAQPDLYGGILVLHKSVTDANHLDETPRMRLVDAVDSMGDNRGELLFELRGKSDRQFALFRVLRGSAEQLFATVALP